MSTVPAATPEQLAHVARQVEALRRVQLLSTLRDEAVAAMRRLDQGPEGSVEKPINPPRASRPEPLRLVTLKAAARLVGRHHDTLRRWPEFDHFAARVGGRVMVDLDRFEPVLKAHFVNE